MMSSRSSLPVLSFAFVLLLANDARSRPLPRTDKPEYRVSALVPHLLLDASAVVRKHSVRFEIQNTRRAIQTVTLAVTIFKADSRDNGELVLWYDKFREIEELEGALYDADGKLIRELEEEDIQDYSSFSDYSLYEDNRVRYAELYGDRFPYTVEFSYTLHYNGSLNWPEWYARPSLDAVVQSRFEVLAPPDISPRFWCNRDSVQPVILTRGGKTLYVWEEQNLPKLSKDVYGEDIEEVTTIVRVAPSDFVLEGHKGDMTSWKSFGDWFYRLSKGKDQLPEDAARAISELIKPTDDTLEKVRKVYQYLQSRTRYVSVQLGIGGWEPFDARYVHERGYGDCKALSNYMIALLKNIGVEAFFVLIRNGSTRYPMIPEFPSNQFNHAIVCVPLQRDSLWLECTSQIAPLGYIGSGNENRQALLIKPDGGEVVRTPSSMSTANSQVREATVTLAVTGYAEAEVMTTWSGNQQQSARSALQYASPKNREEWIMKSVSVPNATLRNATLKGLEPSEENITLSLQLSLPRYASVTGNERIFFHPNLMERQTYIPPNVQQRLSPVRFAYAYFDADSISFRIPNGYKTEALPADVELQSSFGSFFSKTVAVDDTTISYKRVLEIRETTVPAHNYTKYRKFFSDIVKADRMQVVLVRKR